MTQFQETASVGTLGNAERKYTAPFLAITAGLVAVLMAIAVISFAVNSRPSDAAGYGDTTAGNAYAAGLNAAITGHQVDSAQRLADQWAAAAAIDKAGSFAPGYPLQGGLAGPSRVAIDQARLESAQKLRDGWAGALVVQPASDPVDGWHAGLVRQHAPAVDGYIQRFLNAE